MARCPRCDAKLERCLQDEFDEYMCDCREDDDDDDDDYENDWIETNEEDYDNV